MHIAVLASVHPSFSHARAGYVVLASVLEELGRSGHEVRLFTARCANEPDAATLGRLGKARVTHASDLTLDTRLEPALTGVRSDLRTLRKAYLPDRDDDYPKFNDPAAAAARITEGADAAILFWDTWFEHLLPALGKFRVVGYLARPRTASPITAIEALSSRGMAGLKQRVLLRILRNQEARHLKRLRGLAAATNICALDAAYYSAHGVACDYLPNTWPDFFGADWRRRRDSAETGRVKLSVLANIGNVNATGNGFGLGYLAREVLPALAPGLRERVEINVCGGGWLPPELAGALLGQGVRIRGFVDDIDGEVLANRVFLLLNNAGPYTGGYTRVIYAFSSGACLVAHRRLAESMPEVKHGENALLGSNGAEIAELLRQAVSDPALTRRLGEGGRRTYENAYRPAIVARSLIDRMAA
jgi:hypothetical protein